MMISPATQHALQYAQCVGPDNYTFEGLQHYASDVEFPQQPQFSNPIDLLRVLMESVTESVLQSNRDQLTANPRDNFIELMMARFEELSPYCALLRLYHPFLATHPVEAMRLLLSQNKTLVRVLKAAGYDDLTKVQLLVLQGRLNVLQGEWSTFQGMSETHMMMQLDQILTQCESLGANLNI